MSPNHDRELAEKVVRVEREMVVHIVRRYLFGGLLGVFLICSAFAIWSQSQQVDSQRQSCQRSNISVPSELKQRENLRQNALNRLAAARTPDEHKEALIAFHHAQHRIEELIASRAPVAVKPGSVVIDCVEANPKPVPLNLFE